MVETSERLHFVTTMTKTTGFSKLVLSINMMNAYLHMVNPSLSTSRI